MKEVVVGIISQESSRGGQAYLLVSSKKPLGEFTGYYYPPGGHLEEGEAQTETLQREIKEELGLEASPTRYIASSPGDVADQMTHWWECTVAPGEMQLEEVLADAGYFTQAQMKTMKIWPATRKFFERYIFTKSL